MLSPLLSSQFHTLTILDIHIIYKNMKYFPYEDLILGVSVVVIIMIILLHIIIVPALMFFWIKSIKVFQVRSSSTSKKDSPVSRSTPLKIHCPSTRFPLLYFCLIYLDHPWTPDFFFLIQQYFDAKFAAKVKLIHDSILSNLYLADNIFFIKIVNPHICNQQRRSQRQMQLRKPEIRTYTFPRTILEHIQPNLTVLSVRDTKYMFAQDIEFVRSSFFYICLINWW